MSDLQSEAGIVSAALIHLGRDPVGAVSAETQGNAGIIYGRFTSVRDSLLRSYPWNFAMRFVSLAGAELPAPLYGFSHKYALPRGGSQGYCLKFWGTENSGIKWRVQGQDLYANAAPPLSCQIVVKVESAAEFDALFAEVLAFDLALAGINRVPTNDVRKSSRLMLAMRKGAVRKAKRADAIAKITAPVTSGNRGSWINARRF
jgi:hypothetical protein